MSEHDNGGNDGHSSNNVTVPQEAMIDRLELEFNRLTGLVRIGGAVVSDEVALMMLYRAVNVYEFRTRAALAIAAAQQAREAQHVNDLVARTRAGRGA
jgi:hypothetical protein